MKTKFIMMCFVFFMLSQADIVTANKNAEEVKPLFDILLYCNTREYIEEVATKHYNMAFAASGIVRDERHKHLMDMKFLINPSNKQWAIIFTFKNINKSCILGGSDVDLYSP